MIDEPGTIPAVSLEGGTQERADGCVTIPRADHGISRQDIPENVLKVLYRLRRSGYKGYLCGGGVRDLLLGRKPKDFDIATDARPGEIRSLFRNSRIIGRRFRLVHVIFHDAVVEVATFRREPEQSGENDDLLVRRDNTFGTPIEDAKRRDFTVNGLFYDIENFSVLDFVGGVEDLHSRLIRVIGDPDRRLREDPVRMMRAVEFAARLDFEIEADTYDAIVEHRGDILKASPARVTDEILELLRKGWSREAMHLMVETQLMEPLVPELMPWIQNEESDYFWKMLAVLDRTMRSGRSMPDSVLFAVLLLPIILVGLEQEESRNGRMKIGDTLTFVRESLEPVFRRFVLPAGMRHQIEQAFETLWRLQEPPGERKSGWRVVFREPFANAIALFEIYALSSGRSVEMFREWQTLMRRMQAEEPPTKRPRKRRKKK